VGKKLTNIEKNIKENSFEFNNYFESNISLPVNEFIKNLKAKTNVFIFSGIIRDYFVNPNANIFRDIDIIIEDDLEIENITKNLDYKKNSFGGYKILIDNFTIDLWVIRKTWGLNNGQLKFEFDFLNELPKTTFFNFSSILFSLNKVEFIVGIDFLRFIRDKKIEIVSEKNPYPELCIVNSFYYQDKLKYKLGSKLKKYILDNYLQNIDNLEPIQVKHFNTIKYPLKVLKKRIEEF
jgi:predicted house-cleaning noncanonical NTP pyrophosphatase (MazG superfamily)